MPREMLKLRKGDSAIMIKADGSIEMAGLNDKELINENNQISPCILFAAAWAKKDEQLILHLVKNFKNCVREGYFGADAQEDFKNMEIEAEKDRLREEEKKKGALDESAKELNKAGIGPDGAVEFLNKNIEMVEDDGSITEIDARATETPAETKKREKEEETLSRLAQAGQDPRVKRQQDALKAGAKKITKKPMELHKEPDLPVEQTMKYLKATPEEQKKMKEEEQKKKQIIGEAKIEEQKQDEN